ncbi:hypothetical protein MAUB1S_04884 [Mycolicibacterium aubagnense]
MRAAAAGDCSHTASINASTDTGRPRLSNSIAKTARCLGAPSEMTWSSTAIRSGPRTPKSMPVGRMGRGYPVPSADAGYHGSWRRPGLNKRQRPPT